jgi:hypothetical protein
MFLQSSAHKKDSGRRFVVARKEIAKDSYAVNWKIEEKMKRRNRALGY